MSDDFNLLRKAWGELMDMLADIRSRGEVAVVYLNEYDKRRRVDGKPIEGEVMEYCRCGKKLCSEAGKPGHTTRYHLHTASGSVHVPKAQAEAYKLAAEYGRMYRRALKDIQLYEDIFLKVCRAVGIPIEGGEHHAR